MPDMNQTVQPQFNQEQLLQLLQQLPPDFLQQLMSQIQQPDTAQQPQMGQFGASPTNTGTWQPGLTPSMYMPNVYPNQLNKPNAPKQPPQTIIQGLLQALQGQGQFGIQPHMATLESILQRLESSSDQHMNQSPFGNTRSSSYMNAQDLANKPLSYGQQTGQFIGKTLQDSAPLVGAAAGGAFGPLGLLAAPAAGFLGRQISNYSQPYQLPQQQGY